MMWLLVKVVFISGCSFTLGFLVCSCRRDQYFRRLSIDAFQGLQQTFLVAKIIQFQRCYGVWVDFNCLTPPQYEGVVCREDGRTTRVRGDSLLRVMQMTEKVLEGGRDV